MPVVVVANPKGGVGKSTVATHIAGHFASRGHAVMLGDADRQQSSRLWLSLRPPAARPIRGWDLGEGKVARPPRGTTHVVIDTPAGLHGKDLRDLLGSASKVVVPLAPSVFDIFATRAFLDELAGHHATRGLQVGIVGTRVDPRTLAADQLQAFVKGLGLPVLGELRPTQTCTWRPAASRCSTCRRHASSATWRSGRRSRAGSTGSRSGGRRRAQAGRAPVTKRHKVQHGRSARAQARPL